MKVYIGFPLVTVAFKTERPDNLQWLLESFEIKIFKIEMKRICQLLFW